MVRLVFIGELQRAFEIVVLGDDWRFAEDIVKSSVACVPSGANQTYCAQFRRELDGIREVLEGPGFSDFVAQHASRD